MSELNQFYADCGRATSIHPDDIFVIARDDSEIKGVVRLCSENEIYVLRTMQVKESEQGKGLGRLILQKFDELIQEKNIKEVFCMPYEHLEYFYGLIEFRKITEEHAPKFLVDRAQDFHSRHPEKKVILMVKQVSSSFV